MSPGVGYAPGLRTPVANSSVESRGSFLVSLVVPAYNEEENVDALHTRLTDVMQSLGVPYEVIFMDNASTDRTGEFVKGVVERDSRWRYVRLSRNFGYQINISAGLSYARGDAIVILDADLQDPPELIAPLVAKWREGYDVVYGIRVRREGEPFWRRVAMRLYYRILNRMSPVPLPVDAGDFRLISRRVQQAILRFPESSRYVRGLFAYVGFEQTGIQYTRDGRAAGQSKFAFWHMISLAVDGIVSFSMLPLRAMAFVGALVVVAGVAYGGFALYERFFTEVPAGWTTVVILLLILGGVQLVFLGLIGEYVGRIYLDVKQRPLWLVAEEINVQTRRLTDRRATGVGG